MSRSIERDLDWSVHAGCRGLHEGVCVACIKVLRQGSAALQVSLMLTDEEPQDPELMGPEVRPRFQSEYEEQLQGTSVPEAAVVVAKRSRGRPAKSGKWQVWPLHRTCHSVYLFCM